MHTPVLEKMPETKCVAEIEMGEEGTCSCACGSASTEDQQTPVAATKSQNQIANQLDQGG